MLQKIFFLLAYFLLFGSAHSDYDEAFVETVNDEESRIYVYGDEVPLDRVDRNGRLLYSYPQNPIINIMMQTAAPNYVPKNPNDFFDFLRDSYPLPGGLKSPYDEYDYVIVGAGSAGSVLASRLTEDKNVTVLLLEAGKPEMLLTDIPALAPYFQSTDYTWQYYMEYQPGVCTGMINGRCFWPRGKAVGGTSVVNYMIYTRGRPIEWDRIAAAGNYGWSYNDVLYYYMKSERASLDGLEKSPFRSRDGEVPVEHVPKKTKLIKTFLAAGRILGHPTIDYNSPFELGFGYVQTTTSFGHRFSAAKAFLHKQKKRRNLHILPETRATKVLIDPQTLTAYGVEYVRNRIKSTVRARKEVILSAGPIASPQLLMLSGIGPQNHLRSVGIPVLKDLPVGQTLYDHICFPGLIFELNTTGVSLSETRALNIREAVSWLRHGESTISSPGGVEGIGYIKTPISDDPDPVPDIELISIGGSLTSDGGSGSKAVRKGMRIREDVFDSAFNELEKFNRDTWSAFPMLLHPKSVGRIELKDSNPFSHPLMYGNYLTDPKDVATFVASFRHIQALANTPPFQRYGTKLHRADYPDCRTHIFDSDEYWECALRTLTATLHHQIATCRMGPVGDPLAVVDPELRVHGVNRLRVVDSSVLPRTVSAHTHAPAMMIGEKAADMIKWTWNVLNVGQTY
ncbi:glucose dehydrogenase [FAD, quinone]-like [Spodoptera litura]|uniref:Glucose dehydrogenase [FAD, quinone]-like n=1 Tax=Spodoptera litura TaxID=69820 RepID=A0A9J7EIT6_SPOLT|nr:glucose dehydrogenase [FAD, quinone]-like [Spodoptera litura]